MKCFNHADADAVGVCKSCSRALCHGCIAERESGIACRGRCEAEVDAVGAFVQRNMRMSSGAMRYSATATMVFLSGAAVFGWLAHHEELQTSRITFLALTAIMLVCGLANLRVVLSRDRKKETS